MATIDGHDYVEIAGIKWATMNIGASATTDPGQYFSWGNTAGYYYSQIGTRAYQNPFNSTQYHLGNGQGGTIQDYYFSKYTSHDGKMFLDRCDDAAVANWGGGWRMPTADELSILLDSTTQSADGTYGMVLTDKNDPTNTIYFPSINVRYATNSIYVRHNNGDNIRYDYCFACTAFIHYQSSSYVMQENGWYRYDRFLIRPVYGKKTVNVRWKGEPPTFVPIGGTQTVSAFTLYNSGETISYTSSNPNVAVVNGNVISGVSSGSCTITATIAETEEYIAHPAIATINVAEYPYVDFELPSGTKWATMNVGASSETDYGNYYQYGKGAAQYAATSGQSDYSGTENPLSMSVDTARQTLGGSWHIPTNAQWQELINQCTWIWTTKSWISGYSVSRNGKSIFLPAAGFFNGGNKSNVGSNGRYWSSTPIDSSSAYHYNFYSTDKYTGGTMRYLGLSVRPVIG